MRINHRNVVFDAADLAAESSIWAGVLDGVVDVEDDWHMVFVDGAPRVGHGWTTCHPTAFRRGQQAATDPLDPRVDDFVAVHDRVMSLGAKVLKPAQDVDSPDQPRSTPILPGIRSGSCWVQRREQR